MYSGLLFAHSYVRYIVLILLIIVIVTSLVGVLQKKPYTTTDNKLSLFLMISTHIQFLLGLTLYIVSPVVQFSGESMKHPETRYWLVEHISGMLLAVVLITVARSTSKKMADSQAKHRRLLILNLIALAIIIAVISLSGRNFFIFR